MVENLPGPNPIVLPSGWKASGNVRHALACIDECPGERVPAVIEQALA